LGGAFGSPHELNPNAELDEDEGAAYQDVIACSCAHAPWSGPLGADEMQELRDERAMPGYFTKKTEITTVLSTAGGQVCSRRLSISLLARKAR